MKTNIISNNLYALRLMWKFSKKYVIHMALLRFFDYFEWLFYSAVFMRFVINAMEQEKSYKVILTFLIITIAVAALISLYNSYVNQKLVPVEQIIISDKLNRLLFKKARNADMVCFEDSDFYNKYTLAMENADVQLTEVVKGIWGIVFGAIAVICAFVIMFSVDRIVGLFIIFPLLGNFLFGSKVSKIEFDRNKEMVLCNRKIAYINRVMYMKEYAKEMRLTNVFFLMKKQYNDSIDGLANVAAKYTFKGAVFHSLRSVFTFSIIFEGALLYGAYRTLVSNTMPLSVIAVITSMMVSSTWILIGFAESVTINLKNGFFLNNLREFIEYKPMIPEDYDGADPGKNIESIEFRNVSFSYKDKEVLNNISMKIEGGKSYALVGHNGAGKSTIIKLLLRFYDPTDGEILLNGHNIKEYNLRKYRSLFATAFQEQKIFAMSIMENVSMYKFSTTDVERVVDALKMAGVYEKVMTLPKGVETMLTKEFDDKGAMLSGGEFQKIVVARAFFQDTPIKIFDEPSSALDPISENNLFDNILKNGRGKTMLFISHRLSSVQNADWVFMLEKGKVVEEGSHDLLMEKGEKYADIYEKQAINYLATSGRRAKLESSFQILD